MDVSSTGTHTLNPEVIATLISLQEATGGDFLNKVYEIFLNQTAVNLESLKKAVIAKDMSQIRSLAHGIKGSCLQIGAKSMSELARELEECSENDMDTKIPHIIDSLYNGHKESVGLLNKAFFG